MFVHFYLPPVKTFEYPDMIFAVNTDTMIFHLNDRQSLLLSVNTSILSESGEYLIAFAKGSTTFGQYDLYLQKLFLRNHYVR
jgi:hypothetical protein